MGLSYAKEILSISSIIFHRWQHASQSWSRGTFGTPILKEGEDLGVSDDTIRQNDGGFLYALHCEHCDISDHSAAIRHRVSPTLKSTSITLGKIWGGRRKGLAAIWERHVAVACNRNRVDISCHLNTMHEYDIDHGTVTSIPVDETSFRDTIRYDRLRSIDRRV